MGRRCAVCIHGDKDKIDADIIKGSSYRLISSTYKVGYDSLRRHAKNHLKGEIMAEEVKRKWDTATLIDECLDISLGSAREARASRAYSAVGSIMSGPVKIVEILSKTSPDDKVECGLMEMRLQLKMMRDKTSDKSEVIIE
jgi:hypothetical protein